MGQIPRHEICTDVRVHEKDVCQRRLEQSSKSIIIFEGTSAWDSNRCGATGLHFEVGASLIEHRHNGDVCLVRTMAGGEIGLDVVAEKSTCYSIPLGDDCARASEPL